MAEVETPTGDPSATPAPGADPGTQVPAGSPAVPDTRTGAAPTGFTYTEDRSKWVPPHRFNEVSERAKETARLAQELQVTRSQLQALTGATPPNPDSQKEATIRDAFLKMFPQFKPFMGLTEEQIAKLTEVPQHVQRVTDNEARAHQRQGAQALSTIYAKVAEALNQDELDADQQADLRDDFAAWLRRTAGKEIADSGGEESRTLKRYEDGDPKLFDEFVQRYTKNWVAPARRQVTAQTLNRTRPVPNSTGRSQVTSVKRPETFKSLDERLDYAANLAKERGVQFGR